MTTIQYINLSLQIGGCVISFVAMLCLLLGSRSRLTGDYFYLRMLLCNMGTMAFDALALVFRGKAGVICWLGVRSANFLSYTCNYLLLASFLHYLTNYLSEKGSVSHCPLKITRAMCYGSVALLVVNLFYPIFYTIDLQNIYHRAPFFWLSQLPGMIGLLMGAIMLIRYRRRLELQERAAFWSYIVLPMVALVIQTLAYGIAALNLASTVALVVIFLFIQTEQGRRLAEKENELTQSRVAIMLSQIQPHFMYNALGAIEQLCTIDPQAAKKATHEFSTFLRGNLDSLSTDKNISFEQELKHTKNYLAIEKLRFQNCLNVECHIETTLFRLPTLTLQPIVENAVRYGVTKKDEGGTVTISTKETETAFIVTVADDGVGFDPTAAPKDDGCIHLGIQNVRDRLASMVNGTLKIQSTIGVGTVATIIIPKGDE